MSQSRNIKLTVAALDATLALTLDGAGEEEIPLVAGLRVRPEALKKRARVLSDRIVSGLGDRHRVRIAESETAVGGGSLPEHRFAGWAVVVEGPKISSLAASLRTGPTPILARVHDDALWFDVRTLRDEEFPIIERALSAAISSLRQSTSTDMPG